MFKRLLQCRLTHGQESTCKKLHSSCKILASKVNDEPWPKRHWSLRTADREDNDNDNDNDTVQQSLEAWPYRRECRGHDPAKKRICCTDAACSAGKVCTYTL